MTIVLSWLIGNPRRFKIYVSNRVSSIVEHIPPDDWNHVNDVENPADHVSRGLFPSQLLNCRVWWEGPPWLKLPPFPPILTLMKQEKYVISLSLLPKPVVFYL